jgi:hypothetical protein
MQKIWLISLRLYGPDLYSQVDFWSPKGRIQIDANGLRIGEQHVTSSAGLDGKIRYYVA